jgi:hypothetical protein
MKFFAATNNFRAMLLMALIYSLIISLILVFGEQCFSLASAKVCDLPCEHGCELALGLLEHNNFVSIHQPDQMFSGWPPGYAFFILPFLWLSGGQSVLWAIVLQTILVFFVGVRLCKVVDLHLGGYGLLIMGLFVFNPSVISLALLPKTDTIFALLLTISFIQLLHYLKDDRLWRVIVAGVLIGLAVLVRPSAQFLVVLFPVFIGLMGWLRPVRGRITGALVAGMTGSFLASIVILPWLLYIGSHGNGYRLTAPETEYVFLSDNIGALEAHLAGRPMSERMNAEYTAKLELHLRNTIPNWAELGATEKYHERVSAARSKLFSYAPGDYLFPIARSVARFFVTGGEGYILDLFGMARDDTGAEIKEGDELSKVTLAIKFVAKGYAVIVRMLGLLGIAWLVMHKQYSVLFLCVAPVLYFLLLHLFEGWSRFRLPVEAPLALLAVFGVALILNQYRKPRLQISP